MAGAVMIDPSGEAWEVKPEDTEDRYYNGWQPAARFQDESGQAVVVPQDKFDAAFQKGMKPVDHKEMGMWEAFKTGLERGAEMYTSAEFLSEMPEKASLEQAQAWQEQPLAYGAGVALPTIGIGLAAGGAVGYGGAKGAKQVKKAQPYVKPSIEAYKEAYKATQENKMIPNVLELGRPIVGATVTGPKAAYRQIGQTRGEMQALQKMQETPGVEEPGIQKFLPAAIEDQEAFPPPSKPPQVPGTREFPLVEEMLFPGKSPRKKAIAERAATFIPSGNIGADMVQKVLELGRARRQEARTFQPRRAAEELQPEVSRALEGMVAETGAYYEPLYNEAKKLYGREMAQHVPGSLKQRILTLTGKPATETEPATPKIEGVTPVATQALKAAEQIISYGPSIYGLEPGDWEAATPFQQYARLKEARRKLRESADDIRNSKDPLINNGASLAQVVEAHDEIDAVMKNIQPQKEADALYAAGSRAREKFFDAMDISKGMQASKIDVPMIQKLFGDNDKAYRFQEGIQTMRLFLQKFGDKIDPNEKDRLSALVNRFDQLRQVAEDKRLIEGLRQAQGPSSPAIQRTEALRTKMGFPKGLSVDPSGAVMSLDEFTTRRSMQDFGQPFEQLPRDARNKVIRMFTWRQANPDATIDEENIAFEKIKRGK